MEIHPLIDLVTRDALLATNEPTGFPNRTDSSLSLSTRTLTIAATDSTFDYWQAGVKYTVTTSDNVEFTDVSGIHAIYFNAGTLTALANPSEAQYDDLMVNKALVALVYWNTDGDTTPLVADERHGIIMSGGTHHWIHDNVGAKWKSGLTASGYTLNTKTDAALKFDLTDGEFYDEDIGIDIEDGVAANQYEQVLTGDAEIPVLYRDGDPGYWKEQAASTLPYINAGDNTNLQYNSLAGSTWGQTACTNNKYIVYTLIASNDWQYPIKMVQGNAQYDNKNDAIEGATTEITAWGSMPSPEFVLLYRFIMQTGAYAGVKNAQIVEVIDFRGASVSGASATAQDHGTLAGLGDDDHAQYLLADGTRTLAGAWDMGSQALTNINADSGTIDGVALGATCTQAEWDAAYTHISESGASHSYINQSVTTTASPTFVQVGTTKIDTDEEDFYIDTNGEGTVHIDEDLTVAGYTGLGGAASSTYGLHIAKAGADSDVRCVVDSSAGEYAAFGMGHAGTIEWWLELNRTIDRFDIIESGVAARFSIVAGGNVGIGETSPQDKLEVNGKILVKDKMCFTQDDRNEYIDSLADGYLDLAATTGIRLNGSVRIGSAVAPTVPLDITGAALFSSTLDVIGNIDPTSYETTRGGFKDEDDMASDSATATASQQSIAAFTAGRISFGANLIVNGDFASGWDDWDAHDAEWSIVGGKAKCFQDSPGADSVFQQDFTTPASGVSLYQIKFTLSSTVWQFTNGYVTAGFGNFSDDEWSMAALHNSPGNGTYRVLVFHREAETNTSFFFTMHSSTDAGEGTEDIVYVDDIEVRKIGLGDYL